MSSSMQDAFSKAKKGKGGGSTKTTAAPATTFKLASAGKKEEQKKLLEQARAAMARGSAFGEFLGALPHEVYGVRAEQKEARAELVAMRGNKAEMSSAFEQTRALNNMLGEFIDASFELEGQESLKGREKEEAGMVARVANTLWELENPAEKSLRYLRKVVKDDDREKGQRSAISLGVLRVLGENDKTGFRLDRDTYALTNDALAAEKVVKKSFGLHAKDGIVFRVRSFVAEARALEEQEALEHRNELWSGVGDNAIEELKEGTDGTYVLNCPGQTVRDRTYKDVTVRVISVGGTVSVAYAVRYGRKAYEMDRYIAPAITLPVATLSEEKVKLQGPQFGLWSTLRRGIASAEKKAEKRREGDALRDEEIEEAKRVAKEFVTQTALSAITHDEWKAGEDGIAPVVYSGKWKVQREDSAPKLGWNPVALFARKEGKIAVLWTPERTTELFGDDLTVFKDEGFGDEQFNAFTGNTRKFLRALGRPPRKETETATGKQEETEVAGKSASAES